MTRADAIRAAQAQVVELTAAAGAVKHTYTDQAPQGAYRRHSAIIDLNTAFPHARNVMDLEHYRAALAQLAEVAPGTASLSWSGLQVAAFWTEDLS